MSAKLRTLTLNSGHAMPLIGLGTWKSKEGEVEAAVKCAIDLGYKHIDTAAVYGNEKEIGTALKEKLDSKAVKREDLFIVTKLWNSRHAPNDVRPTCQESLQKLGLDYVDLYLMHWPQALKPGREDFPRDTDGKLIYSDIHYMDTWKEMEKLVSEGLVRSIGVSNFNSVQLQDVLDRATIKPAVNQVQDVLDRAFIKPAVNQVQNVLDLSITKPSVNQIEIHPYLSQEKLVSFCQARGVVVTAYSPFASPDRPWASPDEPVLLDDPQLKAVADRYKKTSAQIVLRWLTQRNITVIPKSVTPSRIESNFQVFDFTLSDADMDLISSFNRDYRLIVPMVTDEQGKRVFRDRDAPNFPFNIEF